MSEQTSAHTAADGCAAHGVEAGKAAAQPVPAGTELLRAITAPERRTIVRAGMLSGFADCLWIVQAAAIATAVVQIAFPVALKLPGWPTPLSSLETAQVMAGIVILLAVLRYALSLAASRLAFDASERVKTTLRRRLLTGLAKAGPAAKLPVSGAVAAAVTDQVEAVGPYLRRFLPIRIRLVLAPLAILLISFWVNWFVAVILLVAGPMIPLFMALIGMRAQSASDEQQGELSRLGGFLMDRLAGLETLKLLGAAERTGRQVAETGQSFRVATMKVLRIAFLSSTVLELFSALGVAFVAVYVGFSLLGQLNFGTWGAPVDLWSGLFVLLLAPEFFSPLRAFAAAYHDKAGAQAAAGHLALLPMAEEDAAPTPAQAAMTPPAGPVAVTFRSVTLGHEARPVLAGLDLDLRPGELLHLRGPSGSGKSTLMDALIGLNPPLSGEILISGTPLSALDQGLWRSRIAWLSQDPRLFFGSVRANLRRAAPDATDTGIWAALELAGAKTLVEQMPRGLSTSLGEDGFGLSVGEARRIALARAMLRPDPLLVLADEPTAGLDEDTAAAVIAGLKVLCRGRSALIASHDPALLTLPGRVFDLEPQSLPEVAE